MNIDILFTANGDIGLLCNDNFMQKAAGVIFHHDTRQFVVEFSDMDVLDLNIPLDTDFAQSLDYCQTMHVGSFKNGHIAQAYQVPFLIADDPYREAALGQVRPEEKQLTAFEGFIRQCKYGQPIHREDLNDEDSLGCVLGDASPKTLEFAPHLARQKGFEVGPSAAPKVAPGNAPNVPGLGLGTSGSGSAGGTPPPLPPKDTGNQD